MPHAPFIVASYAITLIGVLGIFGLSFAQMRRTERHAEALRRERRGQ